MFTHSPEWTQFIRHAHRERDAEDMKQEGKSLRTYTATVTVQVEAYDWHDAKGIITDALERMNDDSADVYAGFHAKIEKDADGPIIEPGS